MTNLASEPTAPTGTATLSRILQEGYGPGAWHGPDLAAALSDVTAAAAYRRPAPGRHNIAEIALHHAWCVRSVLAQVTGATPGKFPLKGEDWFELNSAKDLGWKELRETLAGLQEKLAKAVAGIEAGRITSPLAESDRFGQILGVTCHAVYHAGQIQLVKRLLSI